MGTPNPRTTTMGVDFGRFPHQQLRGVSDAVRYRTPGKMKLSPEEILLSSLIGHRYPIESHLET